jgi:hypothetical protein
MTTDLETRLRRYGTTLDNATSPQPASAATIRDRDPEPNSVELELSHGPDRPRRTPSLVAAAGLIAAASVAFVAIVNQRDTEPQVPATAPEPEPEPASILWPLQLAAGLTPWFEANDQIASALKLQSPEPGPAQLRLRCTSWTADRQTVTCNSLTGEGYLPAVTYPGAPGPDASYAGRYVDISTLHSNIDAATYAANYSQGKDVGYEDTPLPQQDVTINGAPGRLIETDNGIRRVTWSPLPGTLVAVETGPGLTRDDLLNIASNVTPTSETLPIALELAATDTDGDGRQVVALGGVFNGEVCLDITSTCAQVPDGPPVGGMNAPSVIYTQPTDFGIAGLATGDIATIRVTWPDGSITDITPTRQPIGTTQAFALITDSPATLTALDAAGNPIADTEIAGTEHTSGPAPATAPATAPPTTISGDTTP